MKILRTLVFFDIDGTLVQMTGAGRLAFILALRDVFDWDDQIEYINFSGATDLHVLEQIARRRHHALSDRNDIAVGS